MPRKLQTGRIRRLTQFAQVGARTGVNFLIGGDSRRAAEHAATVLGSLRGLAAKVGQMASYVDGVVPEEHRAAYEAALSTLRAAAPRSSPEAIVSVVEADLGMPVSKLFARWDPEPFASASIGQVHRATLDDGREVAVKVQHPGIEKAVESDLTNAASIETLVGVVGPRAMNGKAIFAEIAQRFREELDYTLEAERQVSFSKLHAGDPTIAIPRVVGELCSRRVLTTELVAGKPLEAAAREPSGQREKYAETLWRFVFKGNLIGGMFNADPHPGNYLFHGDGRVTFLDFGCVQVIPESHRVHAFSMHQAACRRDEETFQAHAKALLRTKGGAYEEAVVDYCRTCFAPLFESPYRMSPEYVAGLVRHIKEMKRLMFVKDGGFTPFPPSLVFMNRLQFGFYSVLARLDATVDYAAVERQFIEESRIS